MEKAPIWLPGAASWLLKVYGRGTHKYLSVFVAATNTARGDTKCRHILEVKYLTKCFATNHFNYTDRMQRSEADGLLQRVAFILLFYP